MKEYDCKPTKKELERINELCGQEISDDDVRVLGVSVLPQVLSESETHPTMAEFSDKWLEKALSEIKGEDGVVISRTENGADVPVGRLFDGNIIRCNHGVWLIALAYFSCKDELFYVVNKMRVQAGLAASVRYDFLKCLICGNEWMSVDCVKAAGGGGSMNTMHLIGRKYDGKVCKAMACLQDDRDDRDKVLMVLRECPLWTKQISRIVHPGMLNDYREMISLPMWAETK